jgi:hypothetical protein
MFSKKVSLISDKTQLNEKHRKFLTGSYEIDDKFDQLILSF